MSAMILRPLRRAPMMLGGVGFQYGLDEARRKQAAAAQAASPLDVPAQLKHLQALRDSHVLSEEEFQRAKARVLGS